MSEREGATGTGERGETRGGIRDDLNNIVHWI
jgi:hypothetical protein